MKLILFILINAAIAYTIWNISGSKLWPSAYFIAVVGGALAILIYQLTNG